MSAQPADLKEVVKFPSEFPQVSTGVLLLSEGVLITGHDNGFVALWNITDEKRKVVYECASPVETISVSPNKTIAVGCRSGLLLVFRSSANPAIQILQKATNNVYDRVWRTFWNNDDELVVTSTYGVIRVLRKDDSKWIQIPLQHHVDSVFGVGGLPELRLTSGDYKGNIAVWNFEDSMYNHVFSAKVSSTVEGIAWRNTNSFATIDRNGRITYFESSGQQWRPVYEADLAQSVGKCIHITSDGNTIFAGSLTEMIQFDINSQQGHLIGIPGVKAIFSNDNTIFGLTSKSLFSFERSAVVVSSNLVKYQYAKISLIGRTGVGKSSLCSYMITGSVAGIKSTFGKRIWNWSIPTSSQFPDRRIIFHDHGGQETVLSTYLPFLVDSDVVIILHKQTDKVSFEKALDIIKELEQLAARPSKIMMVQTFIDDEMNEIDKSEIDELLLNGRIARYAELCPPSGAGIDEFKRMLLETIPWERSRTMIQSDYVENLSRTISKLYSMNTSVIDLSTFKEHYESFGLKISDSHLKFLLSSLSNQGVVEYYPEISNSIIFNDERYNKLRTKVPIFVDENDGIVSTRDIEKRFDNDPYLRILDQVFLSSNVCIQNGELRVFPERLRPDNLEVENPYKRLLEKPTSDDKRRFSYRPYKIGRLILALSELGLACVDATRREGVFAWGENAVLYYSISDASHPVQGPYTEISYMIGGNDKSRCDRLDGEFLAVLGKLFEGVLSVSMTKKKESSEVAIDVALSFAGEQREFVEEVAKVLESNGIKVFYDEFFKAHLWGKDLTVYLQEIFTKSKWCIMFISNDYVTKAWPSHERKSALEKQVTVNDEYILPVRFDDTKVPGLHTTIGYLDARKETPQSIASMFLEKFQVKAGKV